MREKIKAILAGAGRILGLTSPVSRPIVRPDFMRVGDAQRIGSDWKIVGAHLNRAIAVTGKEHGKAK